MGIFTEVGNPSNRYEFPPLKLDEFIPFVALKPQRVKDAMKNTYEIDGDEVSDTEETANLSEHLENEAQRNGIVQQLTTEKKKLTLTFTITKGFEGLSRWDDDDGYLEPKLAEEDEDIKIIYNESSVKRYGDTITIDVEINSEEAKEFYIDFYANDNEDYFKGDYQDVYCGRVKIVFEVPNSTKVGLRLTSNIENLPLAPSNYEEPPTFENPKQSFEVANRYQNCRGMCFAVSMARVRQAYLDEFNVEAISLDIGGNDFRYSGTVTHKIPDQYFGYGVGGALAANGYAELVNEDQIWNGELQEGAVLQYWNDYDDLGFDEIKKAIKNTLSTGNLNENFEGGHSVIFKSYIYDSSDEIVGIQCHDYKKLNKKYYKGGGEIFLGANLKDIK